MKKTDRKKWIVLFLLIWLGAMSLTCAFAAQETVDIIIQHVWDDSNNIWGLRKDVEFELWANEQDTGRRLTLLADGSNASEMKWTVPRDNGNGDAIAYRVAAAVPAGYTRSGWSDIYGDTELYASDGKTIIKQVSGNSAGYVQYQTEAGWLSELPDRYTVNVPGFSWKLVLFINWGSWRVSTLGQDGTQIATGTVGKNNGAFPSVYVYNNAVYVRDHSYGETSSSGFLKIDADGAMTKVSRPKYPMTSYLHASAADPSAYVLSTYTEDTVTRWTVAGFPSPGSALRKAGMTGGCTLWATFSPAASICIA